jgi:hypothetical protein
MFFVVKNAISIGGKPFKPCICYEVTPYLELTVNKLVKEGKVDLFENRVFFQNGKVLEKKAVEAKHADTKKSRKAKKEEIKEAEIPSPEEIADDLGGF